MTPTEKTLREALLEIKAYGDKLNRRGLVADGEDFWDSYRVATAVLASTQPVTAPSAQAGEVDWRWQFVHANKMRYMDMGSSKQAAERAAEQDALIIEAATPQPQGDVSGEVLQRHLVTKYRDGSVHVSELSTPQARPTKPEECRESCPPQQVCDHCQWPSGPDEPAAPSGCEARQFSDQMRCPRCALTWDMNDPNPPECLKLRTPREVEDEARRLYNEYSGNHPTIHSNRFPPWSEMSDDARNEWRQKARAATPQPQGDASPQCYDEWAKNPYTLVLMKSIEQDYVPRHETPSAQAGEVDWRAMYRIQTAMRYMDNMPDLTRDRAFKMADADCAGHERQMVFDTIDAAPQPQGDASPEVSGGGEDLQADIEELKDALDGFEPGCCNTLFPINAVRRCVESMIAALTPRAHEPAPTVDDGAVGKVIEGFADALGYTAYVAKWSGDPPPVGTKLYTRPAPQADVARLWTFVEQAFDRSKTSTSERLLQDLGLPDDSPEMPLSWHINRAQQKGATNGQE